MSLSAAIATIIVLDVALLALLAWMVSHPRHLRPHVSARDQVAPKEQRFFMQDPNVAGNSQPEQTLQRVD